MDSVESQQESLRKWGLPIRVGEPTIPGYCGHPIMVGDFATICRCPRSFDSGRCHAGHEPMDE